MPNAVGFSRQARSYNLSAHFMLFFHNAFSLDKRDKFHATCPEVNMSLYQPGGMGISP